MYQCSKLLVRYKGYSYFDHSNFPAHSMFRFDAEVAWELVSSGNQVQPQIVVDPDYLPDYLSVSYDYDFNTNDYDISISL